MPGFKEQLLDTIQASTNCSKTQAERALANVVQTIAEGVASGEEVRVHGLGIFTREPTAARKGRNLHTGQEIDIPAGFRVKFKAGKSLRDRMSAA